MEILLTLGIILITTFNIFMAIGVYAGIGGEEEKQRCLVYNIYNILIIPSYLILFALYIYLFILTYGDNTVYRQLKMIGAIVIVNIFIFIISKITFIIKRAKIRKERQ